MSWLLPVTSKIVSESDSDVTMGIEKSSVIRTGISFADAAKPALKHGALASPSLPGKSPE